MPLDRKVQKEIPVIQVRKAHREKSDLKDYKAKLGLRVLPGWTELMALLGR